MNLSIYQVDLITYMITYIKFSTLVCDYIHWSVTELLVFYYHNTICGTVPLYKNRSSIHSMKG